MRALNVNKKILFIALSIGLVAFGSAVYLRKQAPVESMMIEQSSSLALEDKKPTPDPQPQQVRFEKQSYYWELGANPELTWVGVVSATHYEVELSTDSSFKKIFTSQVVSEAKWVWTKPIAGQFYLRVKAFAKEADKFSVSDSVSARLILKKPEILSAVVSSQNKSIEISWSDHELAAKTEIQIAKGKNFSNSTVVVVTEKHYSHFLTEPDMYYIRLRSLNKKNWPISRFAHAEVNAKSIVMPEGEGALSRELATAEKPIAKQEPESEPKARVSPESSDEAEYRYNPKISFSVGLGLDYSTYKQEGTQGSESASFSSLSVPATSFNFRYGLDQASAIKLAYYSSSGKIKTAGLAALDKDTFKKNNLDVEYEYSFKQSTNSKYSLLVGAQLQELPFLSVNQNDDLNQMQNQLINATLGVKYNYLTESDIEYELGARYLKTMNAQSAEGHALTLSPDFNFDTSLGVSKFFKNGIKVGVHWQGKKQSFKYQFTRDGSQSQGTQSLTDSNVQLIIGWEFYSLLTVSIFGAPFWLRRRKQQKQSEDLDSRFAFATIWFGAFILALSAFSHHSKYLNSHSLAQPQAGIVKEISTQWLKAARMDQRLFVSEVVLIKQGKKLESVQVQLVSNEKLDRNYQLKLLSYLSNKAYLETGISYTFKL